MTISTDALNRFSAATNDELFTGGEWMVSAVETHETIEQFIDSSASWAERSGRQEGEIAGFPFVAWARMQPAKGAARDALSVVDFGDVRIALHGTDLTNF